MTVTNEIADDIGIEWGSHKEIPFPEQARSFSYDLETVPEPDPPSDEDDIEEKNILVGEAMKTVRSLEDVLSGGVSRRQAQALLSVEQESEKPRSTVIKILMNYINRWENAKNDWANCAKKPHMAKIVAMAIRPNAKDDRTIVWTAKNEDEERELIEDFFGISDNRTRIGYNICGFDDRMIVWRAMKLGVVPPFAMRCFKWGGPECVDLMHSLFPMSKPVPLKDVLRMLNIRVPAGDVDGGDVLGMVEENRWDDLARYVASDAWAELELYRKVSSVIAIS